MDPVSAILAFSVAAALLTVTPGLDTALVLRTAAVEGGRSALAAGAGVSAGTMVWGALAAAGIGAVLAVSETAYRGLQFAGAAYMVWLGAGMLRAALAGRPIPTVSGVAPPARLGAGAWFLRGLGTNLLNPKVGVFYVGFLPQFVPADVPPVLFGAGLASIHAAMGLAWFAAIVAATRPFERWLSRPAVTRALDGTTGGVLVAFGIGLALDRRG